MVYLIGMAVCSITLRSKSLLDLLENDEIDHLPIFVVNLFATHANPPADLREVQERMLEISFESRFLLAHADADGSLSRIYKND